MLERSTRMRLAAAATALALAAPVWATEIQMRKKEDPKQSAAAEKSSEEQKKQAESGDPLKKKNCPTDDAFFTLEDLFGLVGPAQPLADLAAADPQAATATQAAPAQPAAIQWRDVVPGEQPAKQESTEAEQD